MSDWEWPPDEVNGTPQTEEDKPRGARASASVQPGQQPVHPQAGHPQAGVPMPVTPPQHGIPLPGPQPIVGNPADPTTALPLPPQRPQPAVPLPSTPITVQSHGTPIPVQPHSGLPGTGDAGRGPAPQQAGTATGGPGQPARPQLPPQAAPGEMPPLPQRERRSTPSPIAGQPMGTPPATASQGAQSAAGPVSTPPNQPSLPIQQPTQPVQPVAQRSAPPITRPSATNQPPVGGQPGPAPHQGQPVQQQPPVQQQHPVQQAGPQQFPPGQPGQPAFGQQGQPSMPPPPGGEVYLPTAEEFARRRAVRPVDPVAHMGLQATLRKSTFGLVNLPPGASEQELRRQTELVRRNFGGLRQITVVNPKGGAGKTVAVLLLAMTFGRKRGGYVLAWDNNETQGTLGMRSQQDFHSRTVRDLLRDLNQFTGAHSRVGDLSQYVRAQGDGMFEVLASDESATAGEMLTANAFGEIREVVSRFYKLIMVDTGNNVRAENWQAAIDATDQLVVTMSARNDSAETAARMLDHLEQTGRQRLVRQAVSIVSMPPSRKEVDVPAIERHFAARTRSVLIAPYERMLDSGEPIDYARLSKDSQDAWLRIAAAVAEGL